jgi:predicted esterase
MTRHQIATAFVAAGLFAAVSARPAQAQKLSSGPQVLTFFSDVDDTEQPYGLYLPKNYNPARKYPLVISLHGASSNHRLNLRRVFGFSNKPEETDVEATRYFPEWKDIEYIVATPLARGTMGYQGVPEKDVMDVLSDVKKRFSIDEDRVYLTGLSMGGGGTLWIGLTRPDLWAAIAPTCPAPPSGTRELAGNALNFPVRVGQGGADPTVNPQGTRDFVQLFKDLGTKVEYIEYPGVKHNSWENFYANEDVFTWFSQFKRNRFPERVRFTTPAYRYNNAYWVHIDGLTPGTLASIDAKFTAPNRIEITTKDLGAFSLNLKGHPKFSAAKPLELVVDGKSLSAKTTDTVSLTLDKSAGAWTAARTAAAVTSKHSGAEGPVADALASRHVYVYGTAGSPSREERAARMALANQSADWSSRSHLLVFPRAIADSAMRPSDYESSNLVLFGTKETNSVIAKVADRLPMALNEAAAKEYGLVYVYPVDGHYVVVASGLPWWDPNATGAPQAGPAPRPAAAPAAAGAAQPRPATRSFGFRIPGPAGTLSSFADYVVYKGSLANVVAEGRFDNDWRIPAGDLEKIKATGAVTFK